MNMQLVSVSSKGQISIPVSYRKALSIKEGSRLMIYSDGENIILKPVELPSEESLLSVLEKAREYAREEGFTRIAVLFELVAKIEKEHEDRYRKLLENVKTGKVFDKQPEKVRWECANCGHVFEGENAPELCPVCKHPKAYFFVKAENY